METKMNIYKNALGDNEEFAPELAMKKFLGFTDADIEDNYKWLIKSKMMAELREFYGSQVAEHKGLAGWEPPIKFKDEVEKDMKKDAESPEDEKSEEDSEDEGSDEESSSEESSKESSAEENAEEATKPEEPEAPSFGLQ